MQRKHLFAAVALGLGLAGAIAYAANRGAITPIFGATTSRTTVSQPNFAPADGFTASQVDYARIAAKPLPPPAPPTDADVGDAASFGRNVRWLGVVSNERVYASTNCASILAQVPGADCRQIADATYSTSDFERIASIRLPARASNSLLCHWLSRAVSVRFNNPTATPVQGRMTFTPYFTVENPVLNDPALINPTTGAPFGGELTVSAGTEDEIVALLPNLPIQRTRRDAMVCQSGMVSKRALVETYGLTPTLADSFFANQTTVWLNAEVTTQYAEAFSFIGGLRIVGD
jgi:hypothetical protein